MLYERGRKMEYRSEQNVEPGMQYYSVNSTELELIDGTDLLAEVRRNYFEGREKLKNRINTNIDGVVCRCSYTIEDGKPLRWKKMIGSMLVERVSISSSSYCVETLDSERRPFKKSYFDYHHNWIRTDFSSVTGRSGGSYSLFPSEDGNKPIIVCKNSDGKTIILYPFERAVSRELTAQLNELVGEPLIFTRTSSGAYYYTTKDESVRRAEALDKLLAPEEEESDDSDGEVITQGFVINSDGDDEIRNAETEIRSDESDNSDVKQTETEIKDISAESVQTENAESDNKPDVSEMTDRSEKTDEPVKKKTQTANTLSVRDTISQSVLAQVGTLTEEKSGTAAVDGLHESDEASSGDDVADLTAGIIGVETPDHLPLQPVCGIADDCPYEKIPKLIIETGNKKYYYFGETDGDIRSGSGRTSMSDGRTAYEGSYKDDKRDGFGVYYYRTGKLCYAGSWKQNKREGLGVAFSASDGSAFVSKWEENESSGYGASFDEAGKFLYLGKLRDGQRTGAGVTCSGENETLFVGQYKDGEFLGKGTQFDCDGRLLYSGGYRSGKRTGTGTSYSENGSVVYQGEWKNNLFHGKGILYLQGGGTLSGEFRSGKADGKCTLTDGSGRVIYIGSFAGNDYNGTGRLFAENGGYVEGRFVDGEPTGVFNEYAPDGTLIYCGEWSDMHRNGKGVLYENGEKHYDGGFCNSEYSGSGKLFRDGHLIYSGEFSNGKRSGFGIEYDGEDVLYQGMWKDDLRDGCGILIENEIAYAGSFEKGRRQGRINEIKDGRLLSRSLYKDDEQCYTCSYSEDGYVSYCGSISEGKPGGMGCSFNSSCEKVFEGIFRGGKPEKPMQVVLEDLGQLPECEELEKTVYGSFRSAPGYAIEQSINNGIYTGQLRDEKPDGRGTMLYFDHRFTGMFRNGEPDGSGVIYMRDGSEISGSFSTERSEESEALVFTNITYYRSLK